MLDALFREHGRMDRRRCFFGLSGTGKTTQSAPTPAASLDWR
jgi:ATP-dependent phosphoenolpyruvate carboxykinase